MDSLREVIEQASVLTEIRDEHMKAVDLRRICDLV